VPSTPASLSFPYQVEPPSLTTFRRQFHEYSKKEGQALKFSSEKGDFCTCAICHKLEQTSKLAKTPEDKEAVTMIRMQHHELHMQLRDMYEEKLSMAGFKKHEYLMVCMDKMEQRATDLPRYAKKSKAMPNRPYRQQIFGVNVHAHGKYIYVLPPWLGKGANLTLTVLHKCLKTIKERLPPLLWLQLDNAVSDNKHRYCSH
jgi:hypothetical protein